MLRALIILLVVTLLSYGGVALFYDQVGDQLDTMLPEAATTDITPKKEQAARQLSETMTPAGAGDYQVIIQRNIFQAVIDAPQAVVEEVEEDLEETALKLVLLGTVVGKKGDARAIIVDEKEKKQDLYRIGDAVQNARIEKITRGKVTLNVNGKTEALTIRDRKGGGPGGPAITNKRTSQSASVTNTSKRRVPVVRPRRRISFRESRPSIPEDIAEPSEPLPTDADDLEKVLEEVGEDSGLDDEESVEDENENEEITQ